MKLGVICDGISRDLPHALDVMDEFGLQYAELQFVGEKEVGDHSRDEIAEIAFTTKINEAANVQYTGERSLQRT